MHETKNIRTKQQHAFCGAHQKKMQDLKKTTTSLQVTTTTTTRKLCNTRTEIQWSSLQDHPGAGQTTTIINKIDVKKCRNY
jgi:hypothetical protein